MTQVEIYITITVVVIVCCLYLYFRPKFIYYVGEIYIMESNCGGMKSYTQESEGEVVRKSKKTGKWEVLRMDWYKLFGNCHSRFKWEKLKEPLTEEIKNALESRAKIILYFEW